MSDYTVYKVLKSGVKRVNPFIHDMPVAGHQITVFQALNIAFKEKHEVFSGSVKEFIQLGVEAGLSEQDLSNGFEELVRYGYLTIDGDTFTPTDKYVDRFF